MSPPKDQQPIRARFPYKVVEELDKWEEEDQIGSRQALLLRIVSEALRRRRHTVTMRKRRQPQASDK